MPSKFIKGSVLLTATISWLLGSSYAQVPDDGTDSLQDNRVISSSSDFTLFESVDSTSGDQGRRNQPRSRRQNNTSSPGGPEFTLVGTSRIGDRYSTILRNKDGNEVVVRGQLGSSTTIEGYTQYSVVGVNSREVEIRYPDSATCTDYRDQGVTCDAAGVVSLSLVNGAPIQRASGSASTNNARGQGQSQRAIEPEPGEDESFVVVLDDEDEVADNPFAALRARAQATGAGRQSSDQSQRNGFTPRRINPADVPPGMRIVSTPFGDRLVDQ